MFQYGILSDILKDGVVLIKDVFVCAEGGHPKWFRCTHINDNGDSCSGWYHEEDGYSYRPVDVEVEIAEDQVIPLNQLPIEELP